MPSFWKEKSHFRSYSYQLVPQLLHSSFTLRLHLFVLHGSQTKARKTFPTYLNHRKRMLLSSRYCFQVHYALGWSFYKFGLLHDLQMAAQTKIRNWISFCSLVLDASLGTSFSYRLLLRDCDNWWGRNYPYTCARCWFLLLLSFSHCSCCNLFTTLNEAVVSLCHKQHKLPDKSESSSVFARSDSLLRIRSTFIKIVFKR